MNTYCKRLIEVDLPIKRISAHARREKSIRHGHISTLHIWWARRPLAACRAVICASLWPDPTDELCPDSFRNTARQEMIKWAKNHLKLLSKDSYSRFNAISKDNHKLNDLTELRAALLDFIADFANWDNSTVPEYLTTSRLLTQTAHEALGGEPGTRPLVVDPFAGGGSIPLEALRVGADAFASDLNPVAVLLNKVVLEYIPKYGQQLADEVKKWGLWIKEEAEKELSGFYPKDPDGATPIAYLWARTIQCEGPGCGAEVPLMRSLWLAKKANKAVALRLIPNLEAKRVDFAIIENAKAKDVKEGTVRRGSALCPCCGYTTPVASVRKQLKARKGGANDARLFCVVTTKSSQKGRFYRLPVEQDLEAVKKAQRELEKRIKEHKGELSLVPDEATEHYETFVNRGPLYGMIKWENYFTHRQSLALTTLVKLVKYVGKRLDKDVHQGEQSLGKSVQTCLAFAVDRLADKNASLTLWNSVGEKIEHVFGRQALPMTWDFPEVGIFSESTGNWMSHVELITKGLNWDLSNNNIGNVSCNSAASHPLPNEIAQGLITDPPYYFSVQYADLSDFFYVWLRRMLFNHFPQLFQNKLTSKEEEIIVQSPAHEFIEDGKNNAFYEYQMQIAMSESCRILSSEGVGVIVFAHKSTRGWEAQLEAMIKAGWTITASWPIDTERPGRLLAQNNAALASSIHLVCRPRSNADIGDWRDVLTELPKRNHEWMPRLAKEGIVGADAIFACLGPALEIYSRYSSVEKVSGEKVTLKEYLEEVWAAVSREALNMIFEGADASGFEEDARLTAMWLWTLRTAVNDQNDEAHESSSAKSLTGYSLEYDAARKIAQGLGAHLEDLPHLVSVKGSTATLLPVSQRTRYLLGRDSTVMSETKKKKKNFQQSLFDFNDEMKHLDDQSDRFSAIGSDSQFTVLDQVHLIMILFAGGKSETMKRLLIEEGMGRNPLFWRLAQALSALYPSGTEEKRWVDGVMAKKKGLGF